MCDTHRCSCVLCVRFCPLKFIDELKAKLNRCSSEHIWNGCSRLRWFCRGLIYIQSSMIEEICTSVQCSGVVFVISSDKVLSVSIWQWYKFCSKQLQGNLEWYIRRGTLEVINHCWKKGSLSSQHFLHELILRSLSPMRSSIWSLLFQENMAVNFIWNWPVYMLA